MDTNDIKRRLAPFYDAEEQARERQQRATESLEEAILKECRGFYEGGKVFRVYNAISGKTLHYIEVGKVNGLIGVPFNIGMSVTCTVTETSDGCYGFEWPRPLVTGRSKGDRFYLIGKDCIIRQWQYLSVRAEEVSREEMDAEAKRIARVDALVKDARGMSIHCEDGVWYRDYLAHGELRKGRATAFDEATGLFTVAEKEENGHVKVSIKRPGNQLWLFGLNGEPGPGDLLLKTNDL